MLRTARGTVRAPWRLLFFSAVALVALVGVQSVLYPLVAAAATAAGARFDVSQLVLAAALLIAHWASLRALDHRGWDAVALERRAANPRALATGAAAGALAIGVPALVLLAGGWLELRPAAPGSSFAAAAAIAVYLLPAALWEELLFRGYPFRVLADAGGEWAALCVTSVLFGLVHLSNRGATAQSTALVTLAGFFLGAVLLRTRSLYAAWLAHWGWNWTMAALLHVAVSGIGFEAPDYRVIDSGPDWATGGVWGPEGGAAAAAGLLAAMFLLVGRRAAAPDERTPGARGPGTSNAAPPPGRAPEGTLNG